MSHPPSLLTSGAAALGAAPRRPAERETAIEYWRVERVARYLDISKKRVYQLVQEGRLQAVRLGPRQMRIMRRSLDEYLRDLLADERDAS